MEENIKAAESKKKRQYVRKPASQPVVSTPAPPSAAVVALESQVLELVGQRMAANQEIANATIAANEANARVQAAQQRLRQLEVEVNYRLALAHQMKGGIGPAPGDVDSSTQRFESGYGVSIPAGVGSIPAPMTVVEGGRRIRSESAESVRAAM